jgi:hypothetical protein
VVGGWLAFRSSLFCVSVFVRSAFCSAVSSASATTSVSLILPPSSASASSRRVQPACRMALSWTTSSVEHRLSILPLAESSERASVMMRYTSSFVASPQVGSASSPTFMPPPPLSLVSVPVRSTVYVRPESSPDRLSAFVPSVGPLAE